MLGRFRMDSTYSVTQAQTNLPRLIREATGEGSIAITRHDQTVAYLVSRARMEAIMETLDLLGNPAAMKTLRMYEQGKTKFMPLSALDGDEG
jgi:prevent-host-death family protein